MSDSNKTKWGWVALAIIISLAFPIILNWLILKPAIVEVVGDGTDWLGFWGSYLSALISSGVAFVILGIQFRQNRNENKNNRDLQRKVLKHQLKSQWLTTLKGILINYYRSFDYKGITEIASLIKCKDKLNVNYVRSKTLDMWDSKEKTTLEIKMMFNSDLTERERASLSIFADFDEQYIALLEDLNWFCDIACLVGNDTMNYDHVKNQTLKYKGLHLIPNDYRIWHIIEKYDYKVASKLKDIVNERLKVLDEYAACLLWGAITALVNNEQQEVDKILIDCNSL